MKHFFYVLNKLNLYMKNKKSNKVNLSNYRIDPSLKKYIGKVTPKEKMDQANEMLKRTKLPDEYYKNNK